MELQEFFKDFFFKFFNKSIDLNKYQITADLEKFDELFDQIRIKIEDMEKIMGQEDKELMFHKNEFLKWFSYYTQFKTARIGNALNFLSFYTL